MNSKTTMCTLTKSVVVALLSQVAWGHMIMLTPTPFNNQTIALDPLKSSGENFPCQDNGQANFYNAAGISNPVAIGQPQTLSFRGSAVHGGGSCQIAITTDKAPTAHSTWEVILSIEGGCPTKDNNGPSTYQYSIPAGTAAGDYVLAWTWISHNAGQPEFYMNCAPIQVTAAGGSTGGRGSNSTTAKKRASLPNLAVMNLASINNCKTSPGTDPEYDDPGPDVLRPAGPPRNYAKPAGTNCFPLSSGGPVSGDSALSGTTSAAVDTSATGVVSSPTASTPITPVVSSVTSSNYGGSDNASISNTLGYTSATCSSSGTIANAGISASQASASATSLVLSHMHPPANTATGVLPAATTGGTSAAASIVTLSFPALSPVSGVATTAATTTTTATTAATSSTPSVSPVGISGGDVLSGTCTQEGIWNCIGGNTFQRCASGQWTSMQPMAAGTSCKPGQSFTLWARTRRPQRFSRRWSLEHRGYL